MSSDLQLALDFVVRDLGSAQFTAISEKARKAGIDIEKAFERATKSGEQHERTLTQTSRAVEELGSQFSESFGPAGRVVGDLTGHVVEMGGGLEALVGKAGLSSGALLGIGAAVGGILAVGRAIGEVAEQSERLDKELGAVAARTSELIGFQERLNQLKDQARKGAADTGLPQDEVAAAISVVESSLRSFEKKKALLDTALAASPVEGVPAANVARGIVRVQTAFQEDGDPLQLERDLFAASKATGKSVDDLRNSLADVGVVAHNMGLTARDALALISSASNSSRADLTDVEQGMLKVLKLVSEPSDQRDFLTAIGVNVAKAKEGAAGLAEVGQEITRAIKGLPNPNEFWSQLGDSKSARQVQSFLRATGDEVRRLGVQFPLDRSLDALIPQVGNDASLKLSRSSQDISNGFQVAFESIKDGWADLFGKELNVPGDVKIPDQIQALAAKVLDDIKAGNLQAAKRDLADYKALGADAAKSYSEGFAEARDREVDRLAELDAKARNRGGLAEQSAPPFDRAKAAAEFTPKLTLTDLASTFAAVQSQLEGAISDATQKASAAATPVTVRVLPPKAQALAADLQDALNRISPPTLNLDTKLLPGPVAAAVNELRTLQAKASAQGGVLSPADQGTLQSDLALVKSYSSQQLQLRQTIAAANAESLSGFEKQEASFGFMEDALRRYRDEYAKTPEDVKSINKAIDQLINTHSRALDRLDQDTRTSVDVKRLETEAQLIESAAQLARKKGDVAEADRLDVEAINARAEAEKRASDVTATALRRSIEGFPDPTGFFKAAAADITAGLRAAIDNKAKGATQDKTDAANKAKADEQKILVALQGELLDGLDAELFGINQTIAARKQAVEESHKTLEDKKKELALLSDLGTKQELLANARAKFAQADAITNLLGSSANNYATQVEATNLSRQAERVRFDETLTHLNTEIGLHHTLLDAFDEETRARQRSAAIGFAGRSAADIAHEKLVNDAFRGAEDASAFLGEGFTASLQRQVDAVTRATDSAEAWRDAWHAGIDDALRQMDKFNTGLRFGEDLANGFRDSLVEAFDGVGQKGHNFLKDFATSELKGLQHSLATVASNGITTALGGALGFGGANKVDPLSPSATALSTAGLRLIVAASSLQSAAFALGGRGVDSGLLASIFGSGGAGRPGAVGPDTAGTATLGFPGSTGGVVYGFANGGIGRNGRKRTDPRDTIPALLRKDEYVLTPEKVNALGGVSYLDNLPSGRAPSSVARQRVADSTQARVVNVGGNTVGELHLHVTVQGGNGPVDGQKLAREMAPHILNVVSSALESGSSRRYIEAVRGAQR